MNYFVFLFCLLFPLTFFGLVKNIKPSFSDSKRLIYLAKKNPAKFFNYGRKIYTTNMIKQISSSPKYAKHYLKRKSYIESLVSLLTEKTDLSFKNEALKILSEAAIKDPSLINRDHFIELIKFLYKQNKVSSKYVKDIFEKAFLSKENSFKGEGFFIKHSILSALKEVNLAPSKKIISAAKKDKNKSVKYFF